jgi:hypothetical protein
VEDLRSSRLSSHLIVECAVAEGTNLNPGCCCQNLDQQPPAQSLSSSSPKRFTLSVIDRQHSGEMRSICLLLLALVGSTIFGHVIAQEDYSEDTLQALSKEELEKICVTRGFEIMRDEVDPSTGLPHELSHEDFVEAARRCLEIEREMYVVAVQGHLTIPYGRDPDLPFLFAGTNY